MNKTKESMKPTPYEFLSCAQICLKMSMSNSSCFLFFFSFVVVFLHAFCSAQENPVKYVCSNDSGNFTSNSTYQGNLNLLLASFSSNVGNAYGFYNISEGQGADRVNSIALCRGDVMTDACISCLDTSASQLRSLCPNKKEAVAWYDKCMLRYSNRSIYGVMESDNAFTMWDSNNVKNVTGFNQTLNSLLESLRTRAASGDSSVKYAAGEADAPDSQRIYGLVQCTPDLSQQECSSCLGTAFGHINGSGNGKQGGRILQPSCNVRYEVTPFYELSTTFVSFLPPPSPPTNGTTRTKRARTSRNKRTKSITITATTIPIVVVVLLIGSIYWYVKERKASKSDENVNENEISTEDSKTTNQTRKKTVPEDEAKILNSA